MKVGSPLVDIQLDGEESLIDNVDAVLTSQTPAASPAHSTASRSETEVTSLPDVVPKTPLRQASDGDSRRCKAVLASPAVRGMARQKGINLADVSGSGPSGRVLKVDIEGQRSTAEGESHNSILSFRRCTQPAIVHASSPVEIFRFRGAVFILCCMP